MADWYVSSAAYAAVAAWQATHAYVIGDLVKPTAPAIVSSWVFRCTVAGTSGGTEPTWSTAANNNNTIVSGGATFTNVSGQSTYGWSAAAGTVFTLTGSTVSLLRPLVGDRVFVSSDHSESNSTTGSYTANNTTAAYGVVQFISVNRAGSVPPVAADAQSGAAISQTANSLVLEAFCDLYFQGISFTLTSTSPVVFNNGGIKSHYFKNCSFFCNTTNSSVRITNQNSSKVTFDNTTVQFGHVSQAFTCAYEMDFTWLNTPSAVVGAILPTSLFTSNTTGNALMVTCRGVDLSAVAGNILGASATGWSKLLLDSCRIAAGATRLGGTLGTGADEVELVNCFDGTNYLNERYTPAGAVTTDRSTTLSGGAQDDVGNYSLKLASGTRADKFVMPLDSFWLDVENALVGSARTAAVEVVSSGSLNNDDIRLFLEYMGTGGSAVASFADSLASVLTASAALATSANTWNNPPGTPVKQLLQLTFTPQAAGRVRGLIRLGKVSATVWVNPQITIT